MHEQWQPFHLLHRCRLWQQQLCCYCCLLILLMQSCSSQIRAEGRSWRPRLPDREEGVTWTGM